MSLASAFSFATVGLFLTIGLGEVLRPAQPQRLPATGRWLTNFGLWGLGAVLLAAFAPERIAALLPPPGAAAPFVLLGALGPLAVLAGAILLFDLLIYAIHRASHAAPLLWRFHQTHHGDPELDISTTLRHHPGEALFSAGLATVVLVALGAPPWVFPIYAFVASAVVILHHSNLAVPAGLDAALRRVIVTPAMHRSHHSRDPAHYNANYGSLLSLWDRLFGTHQVLPAAAMAALEFGVPGIAPAAAARLEAALLDPFRPSRLSPAPPRS